MALLSDAVVVIEATASSGTQSAVREALRLNKPAFILESLAHHPDVPLGCRRSAPRRRGPDPGRGKRAVGVINLP